MIGEQFPEIYREMSKRALKRQANHEKLVKEVMKKHKENLEFEQLDDVSSNHSF